MDYLELGFDKNLNKEGVRSFADNPELKQSPVVQQSGGRYETGPKNPRVRIFPDRDKEKTIGLELRDATDTSNFSLVIGGTNAGDVVVGNYAGGNGATYDDSTDEFHISSGAILDSGVSADTVNSWTEVFQSVSGDYLYKTKESWYRVGADKDNTGDDYTFFWNTDWLSNTGYREYSAEFIADALDANNYCGLLFNFDKKDDFSTAVGHLIQLDFNTGALDFFQRTGGGWSAIKHVNFTLSADKYYKLSARIYKNETSAWARIYVNNDQVMTISNSDLTPAAKEGYYGVRMWKNNPKMKEFTISGAADINNSIRVEQVSNLWAPSYLAPDEAGTNVFIGNGDNAATASAARYLDGAISLYNGLTYLPNRLTNQSKNGTGATNTASMLGVAYNASAGLFYRALAAGNVLERVNDAAAATAWTATIGSAINSSVYGVDTDGTSIWCVGEIAAAPNTYHLYNRVLASGAANGNSSSNAGLATVAGVVYYNSQVYVFAYNVSGVSKVYVYDNAATPVLQSTTTLTDDSFNGLIVFRVDNTGRVYCMPNGTYSTSEREIFYLLDLNDL